jgi:hypothetical protein
MLYYYRLVMNSSQKFISFILIVSLIIPVAFLSVRDFLVYAQGNSQVYEDTYDNDPSNHPSGKNRNIENGKSYPQGNSHSNPDGGGVDKPFNANGKNAHSQGRGDYDGNNGCGNDNDFEDDNNGNCGGKNKTPKPSKSPKPSDQPNNKKVNICHATGSAQNPYVFITVSVNAANGDHGHGGHERDIIGVNSAADCPKPSSTPTPTPASTPTPQPSSTPSPSASPTTSPSSSPTPSASATPTPTASSSPTPNASETPSASTSSNSQSSNNPESSNNPQIVGQVKGTATTLPKTGLPLLAFALPGLLPVGLRLRGKKSAFGDITANFIWEKRSLSK